MTAFELTSPEARTHDRVAEWDDDPTPRGTVAAVLRAALRPTPINGDPRAAGQYLGAYDDDGLTGMRVLDLGAGFGCWSSELRKLAREQGWPVHITAIEINPKREPDLRKWCDEVYIGDWREFIHPKECTDCEPPERGPGGNWCYPGWTCERCAVMSRGFDLIIGNPPFAHVLRQGKGTNGERTEYLPVDETMVPTLLGLAPAVMLWHTAGAFDDSELGREVWRKYQPAAEWKCGRVSCRADGKTDSRSYMTSLWLRGHEGPTQGGMLPRLRPQDRRWTTPPGSESPEWARENGYPLAPGYEDTP